MIESAYLPHTCESELDILPSINTEIHTFMYMPNMNTKMGRRGAYSGQTSARKGGRPGCLCDGRSFQRVVVCPNSVLWLWNEFSEGLGSACTSMGLTEPILFPPHENRLPPLGCE